jgi:DnaJ-like protein
VTEAVRLPDPTRTRVVLLGTARYGAGLPGLPAVANNRHVRAALQAHGYAAPQHRSTAVADHLALVRNRAVMAPTPPSPPAGGSSFLGAGSQDFIDALFSRTGHTTRKRDITVRFPAGIRDGQRIRLRGKGEPGWGNGPPGDAYVLVRVVPPDIRRS